MKKQYLLYVYVYVKLFIAICLICLVYVSCGGSNDDNSGTSGDTEAPIFKGFALVASGNTDQASAAWFPATDNITEADAIKYELYYDTDANFLLSSTNLLQTYTGTTSAKVEGLSSDTEYFFKIVAIDQAGNRAEAATSASIQTADTPAVRSGNTVKDAKELNIGTAQIDSGDNSIYIFETNIDSIAPEEGSILIFEDADGNGYLRKVDNVVQDATSITIETSSASLNDVFQSASISSEMVLQAANQTPASKLPGYMNRISKAIGNSHSSRMEWKDNLLIVTETSPPETIVNRKQKGPALDLSTSINVSAAEALSLTGEIKFTPSIKADVKLDMFKVTSAKAQASGTLSMDLTLAYDYTGEIDIEESKEVFNRTYTAKYLIGNLWVYQENTLTLTAKFTGHADTNLHAETKASISSNVTVNANYDGSEWSSTTTKSFDKSLTVSASAHGTATAEVRLIPELKVRFYKVLATTISVEPYAMATVKAEAVAAAELIENDYMGNYGFTQFDAFIGVDVNLTAELTIFDYSIARYPESGPKNLYNKEWHLFGLPTLDGTIEDKGDGNYIFRANVTPFIGDTGITNNFDSDSAKWIIFPSNETLNGMTANWNGDEDELSSIYFTGNSEILGPIGRQYKKIKIDRCKKEVIDNWDYTSCSFTAPFDEERSIFFGDQDPGDYETFQLVGRSTTSNNESIYELYCFGNNEDFQFMDEINEWHSYHRKSLAEVRYQAYKYDDGFVRYTVWKKALIDGEIVAGTYQNIDNIHHCECTPLMAVIKGIRYYPEGYMLYVEGQGDRFYPSPNPWLTKDWVDGINAIQPSDLNIFFDANIPTMEQ